MPVIRSYKTEEYEWAIWKIEESEEKLISLLSFSRETIDQARSFTSPVRRKEFLAVRALIFTLLNELPEITYNEHGKPFLSHERSISISHTKGKYAAVLISCNERCGIDIEIKNDRVRKVVSRFISPNEKAFLNADEEIELEQLLIIWSAKEALFKAVEEPEINFIQQLHAESFTPQYGYGSFNGSESKSPRKWRGKIHYLLADDFVMTWL